MPSAIEDSDQTKVGLLGYGASTAVLLKVSPEPFLKNVMPFWPIILLKSPVFDMLLALTLRLFEMGWITQPKKGKRSFLCILFDFQSAHSVGMVWHALSYRRF